MTFGFLDWFKLRLLWSGIVTIKLCSDVWFSNVWISDVCWSK